MPFNEKEQEIIKWGYNNGKSKEDVISALSKFRMANTRIYGVNEEPNYVERFASTVGKDVNERTNRVGEILGRPDTGIIEKGVQLFGQGAGLVASTIETAVGEIPGVKQVTQGIGSGINWLATSEWSPIKHLGDLIGSNKALQEATQLYDTDSNFRDTVDAVANVARLGGDVQLASDAVNLTKNVTNKILERAKNPPLPPNPPRGGGVEPPAEPLLDFSGAKGKIEDLITPPKTVNEALGQIAQGKVEDIKPVKNALESIDTTGVETFQDLQGRIKQSIPDYAKQVDAELAKDPRIYKLKDLVIKRQTAGGKIISIDYVTKALTDLKELYRKIGDPVSEGNIKEILTKAKKEGLSRKEVNDISRKYGIEFGSKAFNKMGEPLTSVNAQAFENTRSGLKTVAREGLGGAKAKALDRKLSDLFDTQKLIDRNVEAVNKLKQRINERGLLERAGHLVAKYGDMLTGGSIRGFVGGLLPRGAGYKVMNALDIEMALRKNLDIVERAFKAKTDAEMLKILQSSESPKNPPSTRSSTSRRKVKAKITTPKNNNSNIKSSVTQRKSKVNTLEKSNSDARRLKIKNDLEKGIVSPELEAQISPRNSLLSPENKDTTINTAAKKTVHKNNRKVSIKSSVAPSEKNVKGLKGEKILKPKIVGSGDFGKIYTGVKGNDAINHLLKVKSGEIQGAFSRSDIGDIDLVWGKEGKSGYGLAHFKDRGNALKNLPDVVENGVIQPSRDNTVLLIKKVDGSGGVAMVKLDWKGNPKRWIISSY